MYGSVGSEVARLRVDDEVRRAEAYRRGGMTRRGAAKAQHARSMGVGRAILAAVLWPIKH